MCETRVVPYWPKLSNCMFLRNRTHAYLEKGLGADFYKLPGATAMRTLSEVRESTVWTLKLWLQRPLQSCTERIRLSVPLSWECNFAHRGVSVGAKNVPHRLRFTRSLLQSKTWPSGFGFPGACGSPDSAPTPLK